MRQTFPFHGTRHKPPQQLAAIKNRVRKYLKRERGKTLPDGADYWDFDCRVGDTEDDAQPTHVGDLIQRISDVFEQDKQTVYIEILAKPATRGASRIPKD